MSTQKALPTFSGPLNMPAYYKAVNSIIALLRPAATLRTVANHLNASGFLTPSGLPFTRERVTNYLRNKSI